MRANNRNLVTAKKLKNDEFYTQYKDIEEELKYYQDYFKGKIVYCNCDNYKHSNFVKYFLDNFEKLELKKLIATCYSNAQNSELEDGVEIADLFGEPEEKIITNDKAYKFTATSSTNTKVEILKGNGDFRSEECIEILKDCDIVATNPPFSLFKEFVPLIEKHNKKLIVIGTINAITYMEIFALIINKKLWLGKTRHPLKFITDYKTMTTQGVGGSCWYTNFECAINKEFFYTGVKYKKNKYPEFDNYYAINIDKTADIPDNYDEVMAVPISFLFNYCPEQFEIVNPNDYKKSYTKSQLLRLVSGEGQLRAPGDRFYINKKRVFARIFIKRKK